MHILLLEPDRLLASHTADYLTHAGHSVAIHSDPQTAINSVDKQTPHLVITELQLAGRSGVEFLYELRSYPEWQAIPVIVYTNLSAERMSAYGQIFEELNITANLNKSTTNLAKLLEELNKPQILAHEKV